MYSNCATNSFKTFLSLSIPSVSFMTTLIDAGVSINTIRELVGHADERTTYRSYCYDRLDKSERKKLIEEALS